MGMHYDFEFTTLLYISPTYVIFTHQGTKCQIILILKKRSIWKHSTTLQLNFQEARGQVLPAYNNQWLDLKRSLLYDMNNKQSFLDILEDFKIKYTPEKAVKKITKSRVEG